MEAVLLPEPSMLRLDPNKWKTGTELRQWMIWVHRLQDPNHGGCLWTISHVESNADRAGRLKWTVATENMNCQTL